MSSLLKYAIFTGKICNHKILHKENHWLLFSISKQILWTGIPILQKALKYAFPNAVFSPNLKLDKVTNILTNVSHSISGDETWHNGHLLPGTGFP